VIRVLSTRRRHPLAAVVVLLCALLAFGGAYAAFAPSSGASEADSSTKIAEGKKLFAIGCSTCHGLNGEGQVRDDGTVLGPSLVGVGEAAVDFQVGTGRMPMASPGAQADRKPVAYTQDQIDALAAFVGSLAPGPSLPDESELAVEDADIARGGVLFRTNCASCHNTTGQGGALTYGKHAPALTGVEPRHMYGAMITGPQSMPVFTDQTLPMEDKRDIIAFLQSVENEPDPGGLGIGRAGPVSEGLWVWLVGIGGLIGLTVWITSRPKPASKS
jgi:ubiquinol-cytochrome c reductase cytochrome c subunit